MLWYFIYVYTHVSLYVPIVTKFTETRLLSRLALYAGKVSMNVVVHACWRMCATYFMLSYSCRTCIYLFSCACICACKAYRFRKRYDALPYPATIYEPFIILVGLKTVDNWIYIFAARCRFFLEVCENFYFSVLRAHLIRGHSYIIYHL